MTLATIGLGFAGLFIVYLSYLPLFLNTILMLIIISILYIIIVLSSVGSAAGVYFLNKKLPKFRIRFVGAVGGLIIAVLVVQLGLGYIGHYVFLIVAPIAMIAAGVLSTIRIKYTYIGTIFLFNAYIFVRGISAFAGHYASAVEFYHKRAGSQIPVIY